MVSDDAVRSTFGVIGNVVGLFLFLSPTPTMIRIWRKRSVEQYSPVPYLATLISCMVWALYGLPAVHPHNTMVMTLCGAGAAIEMAYLVIFLVFSDKKMRLKIFIVLLVELIFFALLVFLVFRLTRTTEKRSSIVGILGAFFSIVMYAAPLSAMKLVITTKSVEFMPLSLSIASFANCAVWSIYALIRFDKFILIPNVPGTILSLAQLILYATYCKNTKKMIASRQAKGDLGLEEVVVSHDLNNNNTHPPKFDMIM